MANSRLLVFTEADLQALRDMVRAYRAGILLPRRPSSRRVPQGPPPGRWAKIYSETGGGEYICRLLERDAATETDPVRDVTAFEVRDLEGIPVDEVVWLERDWSADEEEWRFVYGSAGEVEGGTVPSAVVPNKDEGWIYKYTRDGAEEDAHADPRTETVYKPPRQCEAVTACDARGHTIGWWYMDIETGTTWYSPWGFGDPGAPPL